MTTGYLAAGKCWPTAQNAVDAYYSSQTVYFNVGYMYQIVKVGNDWVWQRKTDGGSNNSYATLPTSVYGTCTLDEPPQPYPTTLTCTNCGGGTSIPSTGTGWDGTYDYAIGTAAWTFAFITIMGCWLIAKHAGEILDFINRPTR